MDTESQRKEKRDGLRLIGIVARQHGKIIRRDESDSLVLCVYEIVTFDRIYKYLKWFHPQDTPEVVIEDEKLVSFPIFPQFAEIELGIMGYHDDRGQMIITNASERIIPNDHAEVHSDQACREAAMPDL